MKNCQQCGAEFKPFHPNAQKFCSRKCSIRASIERRKVGKPTKVCACGCGGTFSGRFERDYLPKHKPEFFERPCACGCGEIKRSKQRWDMLKHPYLPYHHQAMLRRNNPRPERSCACGCGTKLISAPYQGRDARTHGKWSKFAPGHSNRGNESNNARLRVFATSEKRIAAMHASHLQRSRYVHAGPVQRVLRERGFTAARIHHELMISKSQAQSLFKNQKYMTPEWAERLLRFAAGLPRTASPREQRRSERKMFAVRRTRGEDRGGQGAPKGLYGPATQAELDATQHLAKKKSSMRFTGKDKRGGKA